MAEVSLKHITKIYPNIEKTKKHHFGKKAAEPEKKSNLKVTDEGVVAVEDFNLDIADREFVVILEGLIEENRIVRPFSRTAPHLYLQPAPAAGTQVGGAWRFVPPAG